VETDAGPSMLVMKSGIRLIGESGPQVTILDAQQQGRIAYCSAVDGTAGIEGFTVTGGCVTDLRDGGGILCVDQTTLTLADIIFDSNSATEQGVGGGLCCDHSSPVVRTCTFTENHAYYGGGLGCHSASPTVTDCVFSGNVAIWGGGVRGLRSGPILTGCTFIENSASSAGGGLAIADYSVLEITDCDFVRNEAYSGGGLACVGFNRGNVTGSRFHQNSASRGGAICFYGIGRTNYAIEYCVISENVASGNDGGGGICLGDYAEVFATNCTLWGNSAPSGRGGGISCHGSSLLELQNTIIAYSPQGGAAFNQSVSGPALLCCDIYGNVGGDWTGPLEPWLALFYNFSECPSFCNAPAGDFRLCDQSPCNPESRPHGFQCGLVGALGEGCICGPSRANPTTWGAIKSTYR